VNIAVHTVQHVVGIWHDPPTLGQPAGDCSERRSSLFGSG